MVIFFHCFETYIPVFGTQHINHGYLAVDFFFVLSGFVIGYAYDDRWDVFGLFPVKEFTTPAGEVITFGGPQYTVIGGWSLNAQQLYVGFTRLLYPFLCGLLISRILPGRRTESNPSGSPIHLKGGFWGCSLAIVVLFSIPCIGGKTGVPDGIYQAVCILILFPLIVLALGMLKIYDEPVREWLKEHWLKGKRQLVIKDSGVI